MIYYREIMVREKINKYGKLGFVKHCEVLINPTLEELTLANYKKHIRFTDCTENFLHVLKTAYSDKLDILINNQ